MSKQLKVHIIEHARSLIADERHWCRHQIALDRDGLAVSTTDNRASKYCAYGALMAAAYHMTNDSRAAYELAYRTVNYFGGTEAIIHVNDVRGHAAVLALFDEVIRIHTSARMARPTRPSRRATDALVF